MSRLCVVALLSLHKSLDFSTFKIKIDFVLKFQSFVNSMQGFFFLFFFFNLLVRMVTLGISGEDVLRFSKHQIAQTKVPNCGLKSLNSHALV